MLNYSQDKKTPYETTKNEENKRKLQFFGGYYHDEEFYDPRPVYDGRIRLRVWQRGDLYHLRSVLCCGNRDQPHHRGPGHHDLPGYRQASPRGLNFLQN